VKVLVAGGYGAEERRIILADRKKKQVLAVMLSAALCILISSPTGLYGSDGVELITTGEFHGDEVTATDGERWTGLFRTDGGFELANKAVAVEYFEDAVVDGPGEKTGKRVGVENGINPIFLLRGINGLEEGPVASIFDGNRWLKPGATEDLGLEGTEYSLYATGEGKDEWSIEGYRLVLASGGKSQELAGYDICCDDSMPALIWAGDLDRDGRLDLFLDLSNHYNVGRRTLFLSSLAGDGELVGKAAEFVTYGC